MTLTEFLLARIAEDESVARDAVVGNDGTWNAEGMDDEGIVRSGGGLSDSNDETVVYDEGRPSYEESVHMARHDPARVLAECEAKRRIVHLADMWYGDPNDYGQLDTAVRIIAEPYADHPDYDEDWRP